MLRNMAVPGGSAGQRYFIGSWYQIVLKTEQKLEISLKMGYNSNNVILCGFDYLFRFQNAIESRKGTCRE